MITLHQLTPALGLPNISPPCMKLETWLRMVKLPYTVGELDLSKAPKGKVPFIEHEGRILGDSNLIIEHLKARHGTDPDAHLSDEERAISLAVRRMLDENFYWVIVSIRWTRPQVWPTFREGLARSLPAALPLEARLETIDSQLRPMMLGQLQAQGMGRHSPGEVDGIGVADMRAVADLLANRRYLLGERISTADAAVYAYVANILEAPIDNAVRDYAASRPNLRDYCVRMKAEIFPEA